ncbi:uncharacterized protein BT62DRAFT_888030 [Guyanagaster necrorhizus]|uniref:AB hydrolase-1 domain-containing protein n=1 Tax=Guyanagaster necrorhizus TaxID=856835 RepID=A0A9P7VYE9_9AGAR|nr:uncharacterized protein BT62DRAFT_888030 [Guyanagaster necrorhizus MCA 3950]KAG7449035.1 hypothetical protein BT62DRAFT_888030 [Guyanagaster necrorhizus MCA 3950]
MYSEPLSEPGLVGAPVSKEKQAVSDLLLLVFIHGFKGDDETFLQFPQRIQHVLSGTIPDCTVESIVFPAYETKGELNEAVVRFADWLTTLTVEKEVASGGGAGKAKIVLCGHSMGGILAADTLREFVNTKPDQRAPLWPKIIACIAYDTPYLGLHPYVFKNSATKATEYVSTARTVGSTLLGSFAGFGLKKAVDSKPAAESTPPPPESKTSWSKWAPAAYAVGGALLAGAAAGGAYYKRDDLGVGYTWATDHMKYVRNLWDEAALRQRVDDLVDIEEQEGVVFRVFYTNLPPVPLVHPNDRTFIVLPKRNARSAGNFLLANNGIAPDELQAHTGMFSAKTNDGYYELGLQTAKSIREAVMLGRGIFEDPETQKESIQEGLDVEDSKKTRS